jgi:hypothetical protein
LQLAPEFHEVNPAVVAVVPVEDATAHGSARHLVDTIRQELMQGLVYRHYSPLSVKVIDPVVREKTSGIANASLVRPETLGLVAGHCAEDALLAVQISSWDESSLMTDARVKFSATVTMLASKTRKVLWSGSVDGSIKAGGTGPAPLYREDRSVDAARRFARDVANLLPPRRV